MRKDIVKNINFLKQKSEEFVIGRDDSIIKDMIDTANAHKENCVGLAAVQIGELKRVIIVRMGDEFIPFINPVIVKKSGNIYIANEKCLSLEGSRDVKRWHTIMVAHTNIRGVRTINTFNGFLAQVLQHEVDHLNGIII